MCKTDVPFKLYFILNLYFVSPTELPSQNEKCLLLEPNYKNPQRSINFQAEVKNKPDFLILLSSYMVVQLQAAQ